MNTEPFIAIGIFAIFIIIRLIAGKINHARIREYIQSRGGSVTSIEWAPFGPGWFAEKSQAIYHVRYVDKLGAHHDSYCKTSLWTGVYFTEDVITKGSPIVKKKGDDLQEENRRLREELEALKRKTRNE